MTIPTFPTYPYLNFTNNLETPQVALQRSGITDGPILQVDDRPWLTTVRPLQYTICGAGNLRQFQAWWRDELKNGSGWFMWKDPLKERLGDATPRRVRIVGGEITYAPIEPTLDIWLADFTIEHLESGYVAPTVEGSYNIVPSASSINEGDSVSFSITGSGIPPNVPLSWKVVGTTSAGDFVVDTGTLTLSGLVGSVVVTTVNDGLTEPIEAFQLWAYRGGVLVGKSSAVSIQSSAGIEIDITTTAIDTVASSEIAGTITLASPTSVVVTMSSPSISPPLTLNAVSTGGSGWKVTYPIGTFPSGSTVLVTARSGPISTAKTYTVSAPVSVTYSIVSTVSNAVRGTPFNVVVTTTGLAAGTQLMFEAFGGIAPASFVGGLNKWVVTIGPGGTATVPVTVAATEVVTTPPRRFAFALYNGIPPGTVTVATSNEVDIGG